MRNHVHLKTLAAALALATTAAQGQTSLVTQSPQSMIDAVTTPPLPQSSDGRQTYIITFAEEGLLHYKGGVQGLDATAAPTPRARKLDVRTPAAAAYASYLDSARSTHVAAIRNVLGRALDISHSYAITQNGIALDLAATEASRVAQLPGVRSVRQAGYEHIATLRGPTFIGADQIWDGSSSPGNVATKGQGVVVGVLDTGTDLSHPSFANDAACGFDSSHPKLVAVDCTRSAGGHCTGPDPEAIPGFGHGLHTSSTAAGNTIDNTVTPAPALPDGAHMSGVAPCAAIRQYKVCSSYWCNDAWTIAGIENAIADQVDVLSFSVNGGYDPWNDSDRQFLDAIDARIFVAAAAGNFGPPYLIAHEGPWMTSVAATTQDKILVPALSVTGPGTPPSSLSSIPLLPTSTTRLSRAGIADAPLKSYPGHDYCAAIPAGTFADAIAVIETSDNVNGSGCAPATIVANAVNAGAIAVILDEGEAFSSAPLDTTGAPDIPVYVTDWALVDALVNFVGAHASDARATIAAPAAVSIPADRLARFNMSGPMQPPLQDETKPDLAAPGFEVYAALDSYSGSYGLESGTSMATPHVAGAAILLHALHPQWAPQEIKSALMTTASDSGTRNALDGWEAWTADVAGNGRIDVAKAALAGLTLDETYDNFIAANPSAATLDIRQLNLPSVRNTECAVSGCTWTRRLTNRLAGSGTWNASYRARYGDTAITFSPSSFTLAPGATQTLTINAIPSTTDSANMAFGEIVLTEANGAAPEQHLSVAVKPLPAPLPAKLCNADNCTLKIDTYAGWGILGGLLFFNPDVSLWLNRFTPDPSDYPFILKNVQTLFLGNHDGFIFNTPGSEFDVYIYQDNDDDPSNGATLVATLPNVAIENPTDEFQTIALPGDGLLLEGPGDVLIAFSWHGAMAPDLPATRDGAEYPLGRSRSWVNALPVNPNGVVFADGFDHNGPRGPDLSVLGLNLQYDGNGNPPSYNFVIRANGVKANGKSGGLRENR